MKICFWGNASAALQGKTTGGAELQIALLAKALASYGHDIVIVDYKSQESYFTDEGIHVMNVPNWDKGIRGLRFFINRIPAILKILSLQKADYYYVRSRSFLHLFPFLVARKLGSRFILSVAQDVDLFNFRQQLRYEFTTSSNLIKALSVDIPSFLVSNYLLKRADFLQVQHSGQKLLSDHLKGKTILFPNIIIPSKSKFPESEYDNYYIHVGTISVYKGARELFHLIAALNSNIKVVIVGNPFDNESRNIVERLKSFSNVIIRDRQSHMSTLGLISNAIALICTSKYEGFPNIFLEAWSSGVPVISLSVNPGNVFSNQAVGLWCEGDLTKMKTAMESYKIGEFDKMKTKSYIREFHDFDTAAERFTKLIAS